MNILGLGVHSAPSMLHFTPFLALSLFLFFFSFIRPLLTCQCLTRALACSFTLDLFSSFCIPFSACSSSKLEQLPSAAFRHRQAPKRLLPRSHLLLLLLLARARPVLWLRRCLRPRFRACRPPLHRNKTAKTCRTFGWCSATSFTSLAFRPP